MRFESLGGVPCPSVCEPYFFLTGLIPLFVLFQNFGSSTLSTERVSGFNYHYFSDAAVTSLPTVHGRQTFLNDLSAVQGSANALRVDIARWGVDVTWKSSASWTLQYDNSFIEAQIAALKIAKQKGFHVIAGLPYLPPGLSKSSGFQCPSGGNTAAIASHAEFKAVYSKMVSDLVRRYAHVVDTWVVFNETNLSHYESYCTLRTAWDQPPIYNLAYTQRFRDILKEAVLQIRGADPTAKVTTPLGMVVHPTVSAHSVYRANTLNYADQIRDLVDFVSFQVYVLQARTPNDQRPAVANYQELMTTIKSRYGNPWVTETGFATEGQTFGEEMQSLVLKELIRIVQQANISGLLVFQYRDYDLSEASSAEGSFGMVTRDGYKRAAHDDVLLSLKNFKNGQRFVPVGNYVSVRGLSFHSNGLGDYCMLRSIPGSEVEKVSLLRVDEMKYSMINRGDCAGHGPKLIQQTGFFKIQTSDTVYYSNGKDAYCHFSSLQHYLNSGGRSDFSNILTIPKMPDMTNAGVCK